MSTLEWILSGYFITLLIFLLFFFFCWIKFHLTLTSTIAGRGKKTSPRRPAGPFFPGSTVLKYFFTDLSEYGTSLEKQRARLVILCIILILLCLALLPLSLLTPLLF